jgi:hypothetical protein
MSREAMLQASRAALETEEGQQVFWATIAGALREIRQLTPRMRDQLAEGIGTRIGILSLSSVPDSILMWAHYASRHRGIAIGMDETHPYFDRRRSPRDDFYYLRPVEYREPNPNASMRDLNGQELLVRKAPDWSYEKEWRVLAPVADAAHTLEHSDGPIYLFPLPPECVTEVILGAQSHDILRDALCAIVDTDSRYRHVRIKKAVLDGGCGGLYIEDLAREQ